MGQACGCRAGDPTVDPWIHRTPGRAPGGALENTSAQETCVHHVGLQRIHLQVGRPRAVRMSHVELRPRGAVVGTAVNTVAAEHGLGSGHSGVGTRDGDAARKRHEQDATVAGRVRVVEDVVDRSHAKVDRLGVAMDHRPVVRRRVATLRRADQQAGAVIGVATDRVLAGSHVERVAAVRVAIRHRDRADGQGLLVVGDRVPVEAAVRRKPDAARSTPQPDLASVERVDGDRRRAPGHTAGEISSLDRGGADRRPARG